MTIPANFALHSGEKSAIIASFHKRRVSTSVVHRLPKPRRRVRFPYPAPGQNPPYLFEIRRFSYENWQILLLKVI